MKANTRSHFETPTALSHDARTLVEDARGLWEATSEIADEKIATARKRLGEALEAGRQTYDNFQERIVTGSKIADKTVRTRPYESMAVALGAGLVIGFLLSRRS